MFSTADGDVTISSLVTLAGWDSFSAGTKLQGGVKTIASGKTLANHLNSGTAFAKSDGSLVDGYVTEITEAVKVVAHTHTYVDGKCNCGVSIVATVKIDAVTSYLTDLSGLNDLIDGKTATVDLLTDASGNISFAAADESLTLNLNGHTLIGTLTVSDGNVTISGGNGTITGAVTLAQTSNQTSYLTLNGGTYSGAVTASGGTLAINAGSFTNVEVKDSANATIAGGTFITITNSTADGKITDLLRDNFAFADTNDNAVDVTATTLTNVKAIEHYSGSHTDTNSDGKCDFCGKLFVAKVTGGETTTYYDSLSSALENVESGQTMTLLSNATLTQITSISKSFTLDLSNNEISGSATLTIASGAELTLKGTTGKLTAPVVVSGGTLTVASAVTLGNVSVDYGGKITVNADATFGDLSFTGGTATLNSGTFSTLAVGTGETLQDKTSSAREWAITAITNGSPRRSWMCKAFPM